mgnify:CR=1 FL=1
MGSSSSLYENLKLNDMKNITKFTAPEMEYIPLSEDNVTSVICTSFNEIVLMSDELDTDSLDW